MRVVYPAIFYEEENGQFSVFVPDLNNAATYGNSLEDANYMAQDLIAGIILDAMEENEKIPKASHIDKVSYKEIEKDLDVENWNYKSKFKTYIFVDISYFAKKWNKKLVKKTVNIPMWLNEKAEEMKINFSKTLEEALLEKIYR